MSDTNVVEGAPVEETKPARAPKLVTLTPCLCGKYAVESKTAEGTERLVTGCDREVKSNFAPGHDAKLKSMLINAGATGQPVIRTEADGSEITMDALDAASEFGFSGTVEAGIAKASEKLAAKQAREDARAAKAEAKLAIPGPAHAKVGRKVYEGIVLDDRVTFQYEVTTGKGDDAVTEVKQTSKFKVVEAPAVADSETSAPADDNEGFDPEF